MDCSLRLLPAKRKRARAGQPDGRFLQSQSDFWRQPPRAPLTRTTPLPVSYSTHTNSPEKREREIKPQYPANSTSDFVPPAFLYPSQLSPIRSRCVCVCCGRTPEDRRRSDGRTPNQRESIFGALELARSHSSLCTVPKNAACDCSI